MIGATIGAYDRTVGCLALTAPTPPAVVQVTASRTRRGQLYASRFWPPGPRNMYRVVRSLSLSVQYRDKSNNRQTSHGHDELFAASFGWQDEKALSSDIGLSFFLLTSQPPRKCVC